MIPVKKTTEKKWYETIYAKIGYTGIVAIVTFLGTRGWTLYSNATTVNENIAEIKKLPQIVAGVDTHTKQLVALNAKVEAIKNDVEYIRGKVDAYMREVAISRGQ